MAKQSGVAATISVDDSGGTVRAITNGGGTITAEVFYTDYQVNRGQDGSLGATVPGVLADGTAPAWS
jgi:hypothetical protein